MTYWAELWCHCWFCQQLLRAMMPSYHTALRAKQAEGLQGQVQLLSRQGSVWPGGAMQGANHRPMWETGMTRVIDSSNQPFTEAAGALLRPSLHTHTSKPRGRGQFLCVWWQNLCSVSEQARWRPPPLRMASSNTWLAKGWVLRQIRLIRRRSLRWDNAYYQSIILPCTAGSGVKPHTPLWKGVQAFTFTHRIEGIYPFRWEITHSAMLAGVRGRLSRCHKPSRTPEVPPDSFLGPSIIQCYIKCCKSPLPQGRYLAAPSWTHWTLHCVSFPHPCWIRNETKIWTLDIETITTKCHCWFHGWWCLSPLLSILNLSFSFYLFLICF